MKGSSKASREHVVREKSIRLLYSKNGTTRKLSLHTRKLRFVPSSADSIFKNHLLLNFLTYSHFQKVLNLPSGFLTASRENKRMSRDNFDYKGEGKTSYQNAEIAFFSRLKIILLNINKR